VNICKNEIHIKNSLIDSSVTAVNGEEVEHKSSVSRQVSTTSHAISGDHVLILRPHDAHNTGQLTHFHINDEINELQKDLKFLEFIQNDDVENVEKFIQVTTAHTV
jgi:hypothetical protein